MHYSIEPGDRRYVKGYGFLSFAKNIGKNISSKYSLKLVDSAKTSATEAIKTASKRAIQKTAEATGDLIGNKIADKIKTELHSSTSKISYGIAFKRAALKNCHQMKLIMKYQKKHIYLHKKDNKLLMK